MFHMISLEEKSLASLKGALPEILQKIETEALEQKETMQRLETDGSETKIKEEHDRLAKIKIERKNKVDEAMKDDKLFKDVDQSNFVVQLI